MPFKSEKIIIANTQFDKRIKLSREDKEKIISLYKNTNVSQRDLAKMFNVSRRLIQFILYPEKLEENKKRRAEHGGWKQYYNKKSNAKSQKKHRHYKQKLFKDNKI
ncbi:MAG: hypothetical protein ACFFG0_02210 [Candidatus Thorarchaeota archaeon]